MLENKKLNMIISLIIAIALWAFVIGEVNPEATRVYRDIPIKMFHEEVLTDSGMAVYAVSEKAVTVTLTGTRSEINKIDSKDITAFVDLENAFLGENQLRVDVRVSGKADIEGQSVEKVTVIVEERISKEVPVEVSYEGDFNGEEEPITIEQSLHHVSVSGAETLVGQVVSASAIVEEGTITTEPVEVHCNLIALSQNGQRVYNVELSDDSVMITGELAKLKTVPLEVPIEGADSEGVKRTVKVPEKMTIKGKTSDLETIDSITAEPIYLDKILTSTTVPVIPILPEGVVAAKDSESLTAAIQVTEMETVSFSFRGEDIVFYNLPETLEAEADIESIKVEATGSKSIIDSLTKENITVILDLENLQQGKHRLDLTAECSVEGVTFSISPKKVSVTLTEVETKSDAEEDSQSPSTDEKTEDENSNNNQEKDHEE